MESVGLKAVLMERSAAARRVGMLCVAAAMSCCTPIAAQDALVVREAPLSEFRKLPNRVENDLRSRGCTVPQPPGSTKPANVVKGHFRDPQHMDWAVVCDLRKTSTSMLLVYWSGSFSRPAVLNKWTLSKGQCWTEIDPVGQAFIMEHYRDYGGPKPPPIDHQGINIGICDKASTVSYLYRNRWLTLTGSD